MKLRKARLLRLLANLPALVLGFLVVLSYGPCRPSVYDAEKQLEWTLYQGSIAASRVVVEPTPSSRFAFDLASGMGHFNLYRYRYALWWPFLIASVPALLLVSRKIMQERKGRRRARWLLPISVAVGYASQFALYKLFWLGPRFIPNVLEPVSIPILDPPGGSPPFQALGMASWYAWIQYAIPVFAITVGIITYHFLMVQGRPDGDTRCRKCHYLLRGITEPRCPECGERI